MEFCKSLLWESKPLFQDSVARVWRWWKYFYHKISVLHLSLSSPSAEKLFNGKSLWSSPVQTSYPINSNSTKYFVIEIGARHCEEHHHVEAIQLNRKDLNIKLYYNWVLQQGPGRGKFAGTEHKNHFRG